MKTSIQGRRGQGMSMAWHLAAGTPAKENGIMDEKEKAAEAEAMAARLAKAKNINVPEEERKGQSHTFWDATRRLGEKIGFWFTTYISSRIKNQQEEDEKNK